MTAPRLRIAVVTVSVGSHVRVYIEHLVRAGHDVTVFTNAPAYEGLDVRTVDLRPFGGHRYGLPRPLVTRIRERRLARALQLGGFDVVNCQMVMLDALVALEHSPAPVVLSFHGSDLYRRAEMPDAFSERLPALLPRAAAIHAVSQHMADELVSLGTPCERIEVFQYGVDPDAFPPAEKRDPHSIVSVRALKPLYRVHLLVEAMPRILAEHPGAHLDIFDTGPEEARLRDLVERHGLTDAVRFRGRVSASEVAEAVGAAAVWVSLAESDGTPLSLLEAMAAGAYPVLADLLALHEWVEPPRGAFVEPDSDSVAEGVSRALVAARDGSHAEANHAIVCDRGVRSVNLSRFEGILRRVAEGGRPR